MNLWQRIIYSLAKKTAQNRYNISDAALSQFESSVSNPYSALTTSGFFKDSLSSVFKKTPWGIIWNYLTSALNSQTDASMTTGQTQRADYEYGLNQQAADNDFQRQLAMMREGPEAQVQGYQNAGLNPALLYGQMSAPTVSSSNGGTPSVGNAAGLQEILSLFLMPGRMKQQEADIAKTNSDIQANEALIRNRDADTALKEQSHDWNEIFNPLRKFNLELRNDLTKEQIENAQAAREEMRQHIELMKEQATTEGQKRLLMQSEEFLNKAKANEIHALLPYRQALMEAQTLEQEAQAILASVGAMYKSGLISGGYLQDICREQKAAAQSAEAQAALDKLWSDIERGEYEAVNGVDKLGSEVLRTFKIINRILPISASGKAVVTSKIQ